MLHFCFLEHLHANIFLYLALAFASQRTISLSLYCRLPIEELFYEGKNKRTRKHSKSTTSTTTTTVVTTTSSDDTDYYSDDIWYDYFDETESSPAPISSNVSNTNTKPTVVADKTDYVKDLPPNIYCDLVTTLDKRCFELSLLEIWDFDGDVIASVTQQEILDAINTLDTR